MQQSESAPNWGNELWSKSPLKCLFPPPMSIPIGKMMADALISNIRVNYFCFHPFSSYPIPWISTLVTNEYNQWLIILCTCQCESGRGEGLTQGILTGNSIRILRYHAMNFHCRYIYQFIFLPFEVPELYQNELLLSGTHVWSERLM